MDSQTEPSVLFVYCSYTRQTRRVVETMAEVLEGRGRQTSLAPIADVPIPSFLQSGAANRALNGRLFIVAVCCRRYCRRRSTCTVNRRYRESHCARRRREG
jgi:hypothetical protein